MATSIDPDLDYLEPDFDAASLTIPKLRGILVAHSVPFPSSAKKAQLVDIFNEHVAPQARKIRNARARTKRSTKGIVDVPSSQEASLSDNEAPPAVDEDRPARTPRRSTKKISPTSVAKSTSRKPRKTPARTDTEDPPPPRSPSIKRENSDNPFSSDNPFQSGSSPVAPPTENRSPSRRRTQAPDEKKRRSTSSRRKTDSAATDATRKRAAVTVAELAKDQDQLSAGEEFTPEEAQSLALERRSQRLPRPSKSQPSSTSSSFLKVAPLAALLALSGGATTLWRQEKIQVGFCGVGQPSQVIAGVEIPPWADPIRPDCELCPPHAYCMENLQLSCEPGFVLVPHPLSLGGVVPLPPTCEPDGETARKVQAVADRAMEELRELNAQFECGDLKDEHGKPPLSPEMDEAELKTKVEAKRRKSLSQQDFDELWEPAMEDLVAREEIVSNQDGHIHDASNNQDGSHNDNTDRSNSHLFRHFGRPGGLHRRLRSTSLANIPLSCAIRRSIRHTLARYLWQLATIIIIGLAGFYAQYTFAARRATETQAKQLASLALDRLAAQAALHARDSSRFPESWISMAQLRDDVLRSEFSAKRRAVLWDRVQSKVEGNSNVRSMVREGRSGDVSRVWEWVGAIDWLDTDELASPRTTTKTPGTGGSRYSLGPTSPLSAYRRFPGQEMDQVSQGAKTWEEGRSMY